MALEVYIYDRTEHCLHHGDYPGNSQFRCLECKREEDERAGIFAVDGVREAEDNGLLTQQEADAMVGIAMVLEGCFVCRLGEPQLVQERDDGRRWSTCSLIDCTCFCLGVARQLRWVGPPHAQPLDRPESA